MEHLVRHWNAAERLHCAEDVCDSTWIDGASSEASNTPQRNSVQAQQLDSLCGGLSARDERYTCIQSRGPQLPIQSLIHPDGPCSSE